MNTYIGNKIIQAEPMNLGDYNKMRGWDIPNDEDPNRDGYHVLYPNDYHSWSPQEVFEEAYHDCSEGLPFSVVLEAVLRGAKACRVGWNGKGMFIFNVPGSTFQVNRAPLLGIYPEGTEINYHSHIDMKTADGQVVPWLCSQTDMAAHDWELVNEVS